MQTRAAQDAITAGERVVEAEVAARPERTQPQGLEFPRVFSRPGVDPFDEVE
jgi:hypothetical protein